MAQKNIRMVTTNLSVNNMAIPVPKELYNLDLSNPKTLDFFNNRIEKGRICLIPFDMKKKIDKLVTDTRTFFYTSSIAYKFGEKTLYYMTDDMINEFEKQFNEIRVEFEKEANEINSNYAIMQDDVMGAIISNIGDKKLHVPMIKHFKQIFVDASKFYERTFSFSFIVDRKNNYKESKYLPSLFKIKILTDMNGVANKLISTANLSGKLDGRSLRPVEKLIKDSINANVNEDKLIKILVKNFESLKDLNTKEPKMAKEMVEDIIDILSDEIINLY